MSSRDLFSHANDCLAMFYDKAVSIRCDVRHKCRKAVADDTPGRLFQRYGRWVESDNAAGNELWKVEGLSRLADVSPKAMLQASETGVNRVAEGSVSWGIRPPDAPRLRLARPGGGGGFVGYRLYAS